MRGPDSNVRASLSASGFVTCEAEERLVEFAALLEQWQKTHNLIATSTLDDLWTRHILDSLQLVPLGKGARTWLDLGSGAGFPGLIVALTNPDPITVHLVEANGKKAAFMRAAIRQTHAPAEVHQSRIEDLSTAFHNLGAQAFDVVSARALAPLPALLELAHPFCGQATRLLFQKGREYEKEVELASQSWAFDLLDYPSTTDPDGRVLELQHIQRRRTP